MTTLTYTGQVVLTTCWCGIHHGIPADLHRMAEQTGKAVFCPLGHQWVVKESEAEKLKKQLATEKRLRGYSEASLTSTRDQLQATERSLRGHKAAKTRIKNRIAAGQCPCCRRSFQNVARHMAGQHPDFTSTEESK
jgi:hypothetical protein